MEDETTGKILWGGVIAAITGLYGFFVRHAINHVARDEIKTLKANVQYKDNCEEIVKRQDERHKEVCDKLNRILDKVEGQ